MNRTIAADVAVIGAGVGALGVGLAASEKGLKTLLIEKSGRIGGNNDGLNGMMAVDSRLTRESGITEGVPYSKRDSFKALMEHNHWRSDPRLCSVFVRKSGETADWLENETGVMFSGFNPGKTDHFVEGYREWGGERDTSHLKRFSKAIPPIMKSRGSDIMLHTEVREILMEDGKVRGLRCVDDHGDIVTVEAPVVVCASGGFSDNPEMVKEATGLDYGKNYHRMLAQKLPMDGNGLKMCWDSGAGKTKMILGDYMCLAAPFDGPGGTRPDIAVLQQPSLIVNKQGDRFMDESLMRRNPGFAGNAIMTQPGKVCFSIVAESIFQAHFDEVGPVNNFNEPYGMDVFMKAIREMEDMNYPYVFVAESIDEICERTGIPKDSLVATIFEYNEMCEKGGDWEFFKDPSLLRPVKGDRFFVAQWVLNAYGSLGGVLIDHKARCLTKDNEVVPGLYCVGMDSSTVNGDSYHMGMFTGAYGAFGFVMGREAGYDAERYIASLK